MKQGGKPAHKFNAEPLAVILFLKMKNYNKMRFYNILLSLFIFLLVVNCRAQSIDNVNIKISRIDTTLSQLLKKCECDNVLTKEIGSIDNVCYSTFNHGHVKFYKKFLGLNIRYGQGRYSTENHIFENEIFFYNNSAIRVKKNKNHHEIENYYYLENKLVKFEKFFFWSDKNGENNILDHKITVYVESKKIIKLESEINDNYKFSEKEFDRVLDNSVKRLKKIKELLE